MATRLARGAAALFLVGMLAGACSSDANSGDTRPQNNTDNGGIDRPGGNPGGTTPQGSGTGTGRSDETP